jgi:hypothetical protein
VITVTLIGPDNTQAAVTIKRATPQCMTSSEVRFVLRIVKSNGTYVPPFTTRVMEGIA